jgi:hypothetical protein
MAVGLNARSRFTEDHGSLYQAAERFWPFSDIEIDYLLEEFTSPLACGST